MTQPISNYQETLATLITAQKITQNHRIKHISYSSNDIQEGTLFICKGANFQESYLQDAKNQGAICYIADKPYNVDLDHILVSDLRLALGKTVAQHFGNLSENINLIGITGTKGKSTTALFLRAILDAHAKETNTPPSAILCSILTYDGVAESPSRLTTKEPIELYQHIQNAIQSNIPTLTMEVSSQAVKYHRSYGLEFAFGCYLNIGEDHISPSEHPDFEDYFSSKLQFFQQCKKVCVNLDGIHTDRVLAAIPDTTTAITCSRNTPTADYYASNIQKKGIMSQFTVHHKDFQESFLISMAGLFNIDNALCAIALCHQMGIPLSAIQQGLQLGRSPGRMELYASMDDNINILVDYAHNKMSFQAIFSSVREEFPHKKLVAVFGCPGNKALDRRADMGYLADKYADFSILTEDDPYKEEVVAISMEIGSHMPKGRFSIQPDRNKAVAEAMALFPREEVLILLLGKGAETDQKRAKGYEKIPSDSETALACLKDYHNQKNNL